MSKARLSAAWPSPEGLPIRRVLIIGGVDPCGGAGVTADARMTGARGAHPMTVVTCLTVQNHDGLQSIEPVAVELLRRSLRAAIDDGRVDAVKVGMIGAAAAAAVLLEALAPLAAPLVVDPVLSATAGGWTGDDGMVAAYRRLAAAATVLTPNLAEIDRLAPEGPRQLLAGGTRAVLLKGGHGTAEVVEDRLFERGGESVFRHPRLPLGPVHGTGCALATALACHLIGGGGIAQASRAAVADVARCLAATEAAVEGRPVPLRIV